VSKLRENIWFLTSFFKKYQKFILGSLVFTIVFVIFGNTLLSRLPKTKKTISMGIVGQFGSNQLPTRVLEMLNSGLITLNERYEPIPNIAKSWTISEDGRTYSFELFADKKWSDGKPLIASNIKMSIPNIKIETRDPHTIMFTIPTKFSPFISLLNIPLVNNETKVAGNYDIKLKQKSSGIVTQITLESSSQKVIFYVYSTAKQALTAYKLGRVDTVLDLPSELLSESNQYGQIINKTDYSHAVMLVFNQTDPNLKDKNVRQAIAYAIKDKSFGQVEAFSTINPNSWSYNPIVKNYPFNPQRAKDLIKSKINFELATTPELLKIAENIKSQLDSDIFEINIKVVTSTPEQFQLFLTTLSIPSDPDQYREWHSTQSTNIGRGSDEKIDKLLEDGRITYDQKLRKSIYLDFQKTFAEELPALMLYYPATFTITRHPDSLELLK
jgi:peptide/nickel transport system substrate-binding protein